MICISISWIRFPTLWQQVTREVEVEETHLTHCNEFISEIKIDLSHTRFLGQFYECSVVLVRKINIFLFRHQMMSV